MKIGVCISGSFRGSALTIRRNLSHLREAGHDVTVYVFLRPENDSLKVDWEMRRLPIIGYSRPWVSFYDFSDFRIEEILEIAAEESWNFLEDSRTFDELLADYKLTRYYESAVAIGTGFVNSRKFHGRRFPNHFRNTFLMLHGIYESHKLLDSGGAQFDLVLRLRPDFLMSEAFVSSLVTTNNVIMPIRNSGSLWDYGWGYASDMAFASSPGNMKALCEAILQVPIFWHEDRIRITEKKTLPFIYGDAVFSYLTHNLNLTVHPIYNGGELIRPNKQYRFFLNQNYRKMKNEVKDNTRYLKQWRAWQTTE